MTPKDLIDLCEAKLVRLDSRRRDAAQIGDVEELRRIDLEIAETSDTLVILKSAV